MIDKSFAEYKNFASNSSALAAIRERYADVGPWGWKTACVTQDTLEPVSIKGDDPGWEFVVFMPGDIRHLLSRLEILSRKYDELFESSGA